jgi:hypothetical protein
VLKVIVAHTSGPCGTTILFHVTNIVTFVRFELSLSYRGIQHSLDIYVAYVGNMLKFSLYNTCSILLSALWFKCFFKVCNIRKCLRYVLTVFLLSYLSMNNILIQRWIFLRKSTIWRRKCSSLTSKYFAWKHVSVWCVFGKIRVILFLWSLNCLQCDYFHNYSFVSSYKRQGQWRTLMVFVENTFVIYSVPLLTKYPVCLCHIIYKAIAQNCGCEYTGFFKHS